MNEKNPIEMRYKLLRIIPQRGFSQESCEMIAEVMECTPEESREKKAAELISLIEDKTETEVIKELERY